MAMVMSYIIRNVYSSLFVTFEGSNYIIIIIISNLTMWYFKQSGNNNKMAEAMMNISIENILLLLQEKNIIAFLIVLVCWNLHYLWSIKSHHCHGNFKVIHMIEV